MDTISRSALAALFEMSEARIQQLTAQGVLKRVRGRYDPHASALALVAWFRRDEPTKLARIRLIESQAMSHERRTWRALRRLLTIHEAREIFAGLFEQAGNFIQRETAAIFLERSQEVGDFAARPEVYRIFNALRGLILGYRDACDSLCAEIEKGMLPDDARLTEVIEELRRAVGPVKEDEVLQPEEADAAETKTAASNRKSTSDLNTAPSAARAVADRGGIAPRIPNRKTSRKAVKRHR